MKKKYWIILAVIVSGLIAYIFYTGKTTQNKEGFNTAAVEKGDIEVIISASGTLNATNTVEVGTQVSGVIEKVLVDFNDEVKKGQVIAKIDTRNLRATLDQAKAGYLQSEVQYEQKKRAYENTKKYNATPNEDLSVIEAKAVLEQIETQLKLAQRNFDRFRNLYENGIVSKIDF